MRGSLSSSLELEGEWKMGLERKLQGASGRAWVGESLSRTKDVSGKQGSVHSEKSARFLGMLSQDVFS